jgi:hypothetical protein
MPSSRCTHIPIILGIVRQLAPRSILDMGVGFGKWGHLFREYTDIAAAETDPLRYARDNWQVRIDGIEGHAPYLTPMHEYVYNTVHVGDMRTKIHEVGVYDLVFLGDVIEHIEKAEGMELLRACLAHAHKGVIVTTPGRPAPQTAVCDNELEVHRSFWTPADFRSLARCVHKLDENDTLIAVLLKDGVPPPICSAPVRGVSQHGAGPWEWAKRRLASVVRSLRARTDARRPTRAQSASDGLEERARSASDGSTRDRPRPDPSLALGARTGRSTSETAELGTAAKP